MSILKKEYDFHLLSNNKSHSYKKISKKTNIQRKKNQKVARTRRQRGYHWEDTLVKRFNKLDDWKAFRLGSPSVALPDILVVSDKKRTIFTVEAKSGTGTTLQVPNDQIIRCQNWVNNFQLYKTRKVILAFKFLSKKRVGIGTYENRELREYFKVWDNDSPIVDCVCTYDGKTYAIKDGSRIPMELKEFQMPFHSRHQVMIVNQIR